MSLALALAGWALAGMLAVTHRRLRRRLALVARAAHEVRGAAHALGLGAAALQREPGGLRWARTFESPLDRMAAGLADLEAARWGRRAPPRTAAIPLERILRSAAVGWRPAARSAGRRLRFRWEGEPAVVSADRRRLAQVLGNLVSNAIEHGSGPVEVTGRRSGRQAVVEVRDAGPGAAEDRVPRANGGHGLSVAGEAVEEAGGRLTVARTPEGTRAAVELPLAEP